MKTGKPGFLLQYPYELKSFRSGLLFLLLVLVIQFPAAQVTIKGVVNNYYKVIEVDQAKACVRVTNPAGLQKNDKVMLVQMKGATINTSAGSSSFGTILNQNNAGNYEIGTVCTVIGDTVFLVYMMLNQYTVTDKVQLVSIPHYVSATVIDTLKAAPWNNTTGTGGILAISVEQDLVLNAPVYVDSGGYRGGSFRLSSGTCGNTFIPPPALAYAYDGAEQDPQMGAFKGEGIADVAQDQTGGRGAPANGGGGGNNHNNGGAGGANLTSGGNGGANSSSGGCTLALQGQGGRALNRSGGDKIFLGGGGGAGHSNNGTATSRGGGHGGGIIFIEANNVVGNNFKIVANGQPGGNALGDGGGGGGAGGTIILDVNNYTGALTIQANGGAGGNVNNQFTAGRCYGGGGGGSGGTIYFSGTTPVATISYTGGLPGAETSRSGTCNASIPGIAGTAGQLFTNYAYRSSTVLESSYCAYLLPVELVWFKALYNNGQAILKWQVSQLETARTFIVERSPDGRHWTPLQEVQIANNVKDYQAIDPTPHSKTNYYRLKLIDIDYKVNYSAIQKIYIPAGNELIKVYPNPAHNRITITGNFSIVNELTLHELSGKTIWKKRLDTRLGILEIELPDLPAGVYVIRIGEITKKLSVW